MRCANGAGRTFSWSTRPASIPMQTSARRSHRRLDAAPSRSRGRKRPTPSSSSSTHRSGRNPLDEDVAAILRRTRKPVVLVANKAESPKAAAAVYGEFARLGFGEPVAVSAIHGEGTGDLLDRVIDHLPAQAPAADLQGELSLALVGRPNVGKSSLLNAMLNEERAVVSDVPGTTRDAIDTIFQFHEHRVRLIDTAGVRKKPQQHGAIEYYSALRSLSAIARCDIAILLFDAMAGMQNQERRLAGMILEERKGLIIVGNKWDLAREQGEYSQGELINVIYEQVPFARFAPVTFLSAKTRRRLGSLMPLVMKVASNLDRHVPTAQLNNVIRDAVSAHPAPAPGGKPFKIFYCSQPASHPPLFVFHCNDPGTRAIFVQAVLGKRHPSELRVRRRSAHARVPGTLALGRAGMIYAGIAIAAFLIGSIPFGLVIGRRSTVRTSVNREAATSAP